MLDARAEHFRAEQPAVFRVAVDADQAGILTDDHGATLVVVAHRADLDVVEVEISVRAPDHGDLRVAERDRQRRAPEMGANGLLRFYMAHVLGFPVLLFIFVGVHYYKVVIHGHSLPPRSENIGEDTAKRVPLDKRVYFIPDVLTNEIMWFAVTTFILVVLCIWFYHAPLESHADPQITPLGTTAPWYFLWIQGALKVGDKTFWGVIFPGILLTFLMLVPYVDVTPSRRFADRRIAFSVSFIMLAITVLTSYMGLPEFGVQTAPDQEILHSITFEPAHNRMGLILPVPFDELLPGAYTTREIMASEADAKAAVEAFNAEIAANGELEHLTEHLTAANLDMSAIRLNFTELPAGSPELRHVMEAFAAKLESENKELLDAWGAIIITPNQGNLKRIDIIINWQEVQLENGRVVLDENGAPIPVTDAEGNLVRRTNSDHIFINEDSAYFD